MKKFVGIYLAIAVIFATYRNIWGPVAYKGFAYNLGQSLFWPAMISFGVWMLIVGIVVVGIVLMAVASRGK